MFPWPRTLTVTTFEFRPGALNVSVVAPVATPCTSTVVADSVWPCATVTLAGETVAVAGLPVPTLTVTPPTGAACDSFTW